MCAQMLVGFACARACEPVQLCACARMHARTCVCVRLCVCIRACMHAHVRMSRDSPGKRILNRALIFAIFVTQHVQRSSNGTSDILRAFTRLCMCKCAFQCAGMRVCLSLQKGRMHLNLVLYQRFGRMRHHSMHVGQIIPHVQRGSLHVCRGNIPCMQEGITLCV